MHANKHTNIYCIAKQRFDPKTWFQMVFQCVAKKHVRVQNVMMTGRSYCLLKPWDSLRA